MTVLVVGGDRLGAIPKQLETRGITEVIHWRGRNKGKASLSKQIPDRVRQIFVFCDFVGHELAKSVKKQAKVKGIPIVFCRRSSAWLSCCPNPLCEEALVSLKAEKGRKQEI
ncbi:MAG: DUF2325 domain-containing protein [Chloroflexi bacterium]|nr:DUF2325 domain-containing protein [Chloroflexota bacterium]